MTPEQVSHIVRNWTPDMDTWQGDRSWTEDDESVYRYPPRAGIVPAIDRKKWPEMPEAMADQARAYIRCITARYPLQLRAMLGLPMWLRFVDEYAKTEKFTLAMRAI